MKTKIYETLLRIFTNGRRKSQVYFLQTICCVDVRGRDKTTLCKQTKGNKINKTKLEKLEDEIGTSLCILVSIQMYVVECRQ